MKQLQHKTAPPHASRLSQDNKKKNIEIYDAEVVARDYIEINGRIVYIDDRSIFVKIPNGLLRVYKIRVNGNIRMQIHTIRK